MKPKLTVIAGRPAGWHQLDNAGAEEVHYLGVKVWSWLDGVFLAIGVGFLAALMIFTLHLA